MFPFLARLLLAKKGTYVLVYELKPAKKITYSTSFTVKINSILNAVRSTLLVQIELQIFGRK